ncbi:Secreted frizzled- protein 1 [Clonorchis sinensis]|uniref:Secreted frizzled- protein 1 n=2 Tax=Clonorchis sinensis TaxID=79923 RepID=A0A8T1M7K2_CLOSI|nr:Secreted frizzled- protein 1 [Clonorchis sinensis]GAA47950.1 secreted frizzled-related protein 1 [Clonorchis sinensis]
MYIVWIFAALQSFVLACDAIGPGLSRLKPNIQNNDPSSVSWESTSIGYSNEPNSYAYWNCHTIPPNMTLCKSVGYSRMVLPNFLQHESIREVIQQANVWVALVNTDCHPDIQRFLCSLYAPVCLKSHQEAKIPPCWELCDQVRNACLPRMRLFGFDWPEIVQCKQFPRLAESMCIPPQETTAVKCAPCEQAITLENIASSYCMADVVLKASFKDVELQSNRASLKLTMNSRTRALKLHRKDGTIATSFDFQRLKKRNRMRRLRSAKSRIYRHAATNEANSETFASLPSMFSHIPQGKHWLVRSHRSVGQSPSNAMYIQKLSSKQDTSRKRRTRNSQLNDMDGITELLLGCSTCSSLGQSMNTETNAELDKKRWLVMGRRVLDDKSQNFTNQVQVTFMVNWDRDSAEFRRSLAAIRTQPVSHLCPKRQSVITDPIVTAAEARNLKISRSAPSELADAPSQMNSRSIFRSDRQSSAKKSAAPTGSEVNLERKTTSSTHTFSRQRENHPRPTEPGKRKGSVYHTANPAFNPETNRPPTTLTTNSIQNGNHRSEGVQPYSRNEGTAGNGKRPDEVLNDRLRYTQWLSSPQATQWYKPNMRAAADLQSTEERRQQRRRERRLWRRKQKEAQLNQQAGQPTGAHHSELKSNLRQQPINPYGNEDRSPSYWP